jgi:hypothetical protein
MEDGSRDVAPPATSQALRAPLPAWCGGRRILLARIVVSRFVFDRQFPGGGSSEGVNRRNRRVKGG